MLREPGRTASASHQWPAKHASTACPALGPFMTWELSLQRSIYSDFPDLQGLGRQGFRIQENRSKLILEFLSYLVYFPASSSHLMNALFPQGRFPAPGYPYACSLMRLSLRPTVRATGQVRTEWSASACCQSCCFWNHSFLPPSACRLTQRWPPKHRWKTLETNKTKRLSHLIFLRASGFGCPLFFPHLPSWPWYSSSRDEVSVVFITGRLSSY